MSFRVQHRYLTFVFTLLFLCSFAGMEARKDKFKSKFDHIERNNNYANPKADALPAVSPRDRMFVQMEKCTIRRGGDFPCLEGIDVSHYQGDIDWKQVADTKEVGYVYIKATESNWYIDNTYEYNLNEARRNGLLVGSYHFFHATSTTEEQLAHMTAFVKKEQQDLVPMIDVEKIKGVSVEVYVARLHEFLDAVEMYYGCKPLLYTYYNFYHKYLQGEGFEGYPMMLAHYRADEPPVLNDGRKYEFWQYSSTGRISGIRGNVDRSRFIQGMSSADLFF